MKTSELKQIIKESIRQILKESEQFPFDKLEDHIIDNIDDIKSNMETYGWELKDIKSIRNYYDLAHLLDIDTRELQDVELRMYANTTYEILKNELGDSLGENILKEEKKKAYGQVDSFEEAKKNGFDFDYVLYDDKGKIKGGFKNMNVPNYTAIGTSTSKTPNKYRSVWTFKNKDEYKNKDNWTK